MFGKLGVEFTSWLIWLVLFVYSLITILSFLGQFFWAFELLSHFRIQIFVGGFAIAVFLLLLKRRSIAFLLLAVALVVNASPFFALSGTASPIALSGADTAGIRVMSVNFRYAYGDALALQRLVFVEDPEIVVLTEIYSRKQELQALFANQYIHQFYAGVDHSSAILILSRMPFVSRSVQTRADGKFPIVDTELCFSGSTVPKCFHLIAMHTPRPGPNGQTKQRNHMLWQAAKIAAGKPSSRTIVAGDFNVTRWSPAFTQMLKQGSLLDSKRGLWAANTWISRYPPFGLSIDHILHGDGFLTVDRRVGSDIGSDHLPVVVDLVFDTL